MIIKLPESLMVTSLDELEYTLEKKKRKNVILFVDVRKFGMRKEEQLRISEKVRAIKNKAYFDYSRKNLDIIFFIKQDYARRKGLI